MAGCGPGGCWKETGEVWVLLGVRWLFREGARDGVNVKPRSRYPVHTQLQGWVPGLCHQLPTVSRTAKLAGFVYMVSPVFSALGCKGLTSVAAARASTTNFFLSTWVSVPAHSNPGQDAEGWQIAAGAGARRQSPFMRSILGPPRPLILN